MGGFAFDPTVDNEWTRLRRLAKARPGVVHVGYETGQMALYFDPPRDGISRVTLTAVASPSPGTRLTRYYHAVVHWVGRRDRSARSGRREVFQHPFPALDWLYETVPDLDLLETFCIGAPDDGDGTGCN